VRTLTGLAKRGQTQKAPDPKQPANFGGEIHLYNRSALM
jgi:hypothetical protein